MRLYGIQYVSEDEGDGGGVRGGEGGVRGGEGGGEGCWWSSGQPKQGWLVRERETDVCI